MSCWYLLADRFTPWTDQARVRGYIVVIATQVGGELTAVHVGVNQNVEEKQIIAEIDTS